MHAATRANARFLAPFRSLPRLSLSFAPSSSLSSQQAGGPVLSAASAPLWPGYAPCNYRPAGSCGGRPHPNNVTRCPVVSQDRYFSSATPPLLSERRRRNDEHNHNDDDTKEEEEKKEDTAEEPRQPASALTILTYPHAALVSKKNHKITQEELHDGSIHALAQQMLQLMYRDHGVGLAAPQVGINKQLLVLNETGDPLQPEYERVFVNPTILKCSNTTETMEEGCLSLPDITGDVTRSKWIKLKALDIAQAPPHQQQERSGKKHDTTRGTKITSQKFEGWVARVIQHEYDHLHGTLILDRFSEEHRRQMQPLVDALIADTSSQ